MSDPHLALLAELIEQADGPAEYLEGQAWDWTSATFTGHRHRFRLALPAPAAERLCAALDPALCLLRGHFVAELAGRVAEPGIVEVTALTVVEPG